MSAFAQIKVSNRQKSPTDFPLFVNGEVCNIYIDSLDFKVVETASLLFSEDIQRVTGVKREVSFSELVRGKQIVVIGTLGYNLFIDRLVEQG